jgi:hypothetical protein
MFDGQYIPLERGHSLCSKDQNLKTGSVCDRDLLNDDRRTEAELQ